MICSAWASLGGSAVESACNAGDVGSIPGLGRSPGGENGKPLQYSCLGNPMDRGAWWAAVDRVAKSQTRLSMHTYSGYSVLHASEGARSSSSSDNHIHMCHLLFCGYISVTPRSGLGPFQLISVKWCSWIYSLSGQDIVQSQSHDQLFATPMDCSTQASLSLTVSQDLPKFMPIESVMPSSHFIPLPPSSAFAFKLSQHQGLFQ